MVEDGLEREQAVKLFWWEKLAKPGAYVCVLACANSIEVSGFWLPQTALFHAAGTEGCHLLPLLGAVQDSSGLSLPALAITSSQGRIYF